MTLPTEQVRALLTVAADEMPGGPIGIPLPGPLVGVGSDRRRRWGALGAAFIVVLTAIVVPVVTIRRPESGPMPGPVPLVGYRVPVVGAYPTSGPATAAALAGGHWSRLPAAPIAGRIGAATVWTGRQMVIWGGTGRDETQPYADGAAYDPASGQWQPLPAGPLAARFYMTSVWTGDELFIWGGYRRVNGQLLVSDDGAVYNPSTQTWRRMARSPLAERVHATALWTGRQVVVIGGWPATPNPAGGSSVDAAAYDPATNTWQMLPAVPVPDPREVQYLHAAATPDGISVWSFWEHTVETSPSEFTSNSGVGLFQYDPRAGTWHAVDATQPRELDSPLWTGKELLFPAARPYLGAAYGPFMVDLKGWRLDPSTGTWLRMAHGPVDDLLASSIWTGAALLSYDSRTNLGDAHGVTTTYPGEAAAWDPATDRWYGLPAAPFVGTDEISAVWTGNRLLVWGLMNPSKGDGSVTMTVGLSFGP